MEDRQQIINVLIENKILLPNGNAHNRAKQNMMCNQTMQQLVFNLTPTVVIPDVIESFDERVYCIKQGLIGPTICPICSKPNRFQQSTRAYSKNCSKQCAARNPDRLNKKRATSTNKYGTINPLSSLQIKQKTLETSLKRYGTERPCQSDIVKNKIKQTFAERYEFGHPMRSDSIQTQIRQTSQIYYGVDHYTQNVDVKLKKLNTLLQRYGVEHARHVHLPMGVLETLQDRNWLYDQHTIQRKTVLAIAQDLGVSVTMVKNYLNIHNIDHQYFFSSAQEDEIKSFLATNDVDFIANTRNIIAPYEIDIYIPSQKIAIEYCGLYWHSIGIRDGMTPSYHLKKLQMCESRGIRLITIFEDEWLYKRQIVENKLLSVLGALPNKGKIHGRQCHIEPISIKAKNAFLNQFHIQGSGPGSISYGAIHNNRLVAVMTFIKKADGVFILNRFCSCGQVHGIFAKLLSYFKRNNAWTQILSFADRRWSQGDVYVKNNFVLDKVLLPDYTYVVKDTRVHKFNFRHKHLTKRLVNYDPTLSESVNTMNNGIHKIYDCGLLRYVINRGELEL
jgi:hypothetical protein